MKTPSLEHSPDAAVSRVLKVPFSEGMSPQLLELLEPVIAGVLNGQDTAERILGRFLRANKHFTAIERRVCVEAIYGVGLWRRRLRWNSEDNGPKELLHRLIANFAGLGGDCWRDVYSFPDWIACIFEERFGIDQMNLVGMSTNMPAPIFLRCCLPSREMLIERLSQREIIAVPGRWAPFSLMVTSPRPNLTGVAKDFYGAFEVQDEGSQLLGALVEAKNGDVVLDMCCGAGGKTLQLAQAVGKKGRVFAFDIDQKRLDRLQVRARNAGVLERITICKDFPYDCLFDWVLIDAPCSQLGVLRRGPNTRWEISPELLVEMPKIQLGLLQKAIPQTKIGGFIVYGTCSLSKQENETVVEQFLCEYDGQVKLMRANVQDSLLDPLTKKYLLLAPHIHNTDGFFGAVFQRMA